MTSNKGMGPKKQFWPIRMKLSKPFRRQLTHYAEKFLHGLLSNMSPIKCPTPIGSTKKQTLNELRYKFGSVYVPENIQKIFYQSYCLPMIDYGSISWGSTSKMDIERINKLQKQQHGSF